MVHRTWGLAEFGVILLFLSLGIFLVLLRHFPNTLPFAKELHGIPRIDISLNNTSIETINSGPKETKYPGNHLTLTATDYHATSYGNVEIKGRGNSTWWHDGKRPYQIKFASAVNLFDMGASRKYILLANAFDDSFLRNEAAFYIEKMLGEPFAFSGRFIELYVDNNYQGLYYLTTKAEVSKSRINLHSQNGILVELENMRTQDVKCYYTITKTCLIASDSVNSINEPTAMQDFLASFNMLESAIKSHNFKVIEQLIDVDSFARYYILNEFTTNPDAYVTSFFFYKDGENDKIHAGPGWDFDLALGNTKWDEDYDKSFYSPDILHNLDTYASQTSGHSKILLELSKMPEFISRVEELYQSTMFGHKDALISHIKDQSSIIISAAQHDRELWGQGNLEDAVAELIDWISRRYDLFDREYGNSNSLTNKLSHT